MIINNIQFNCDLPEILTELQSQLKANNIPLLEKTKDSGSDIMVQCPYHGNGQERRPSAGIRKSDGMFHCFACGETHSLAEMITHCFGRYDDMLGKFGWNWLLKNFATVQVEERKDVELDFARSGSNGNSVCDNSGSGVFVGEEELDRYRYYHPYWKERGIVDEEIIELFDLGYDRDLGCITFPNRDVFGNTLFVARRSVKTKYFHYPRNVEKPLYGLYELNLVGMPSELLICESMIDCLLLWQSRFYAVALNGLGSASQIDMLNRLPCRKFILCTDNDTAGMKAHKELRKQLKNKIITEIEFPDGVKDVGECTREEIDNILDWEVF